MLASGASGTGTWYYVPTYFAGPTCDGSPLSTFIAAHDYSTGYPSCASYTAGPNQLTMTQLNSSNVIAIGQLFNNAANRATYCGKQVIVTVNGAPVAAPDEGVSSSGTAARPAPPRTTSKTLIFHCLVLVLLQAAWEQPASRAWSPMCPFKSQTSRSRLLSLETVLFLLNYLRPESFIAGWPSHYRLYIRPYNYCSSLSNIFMTIPTLFTAYSVIHYFAPHFTS